MNLKNLSPLALIQHLEESVVITDDKNRIVAINPAFTRITGFRLKDVIGQNPRVLKSGTHTSSFYRRMWRDLKKNGVWGGEIINRRKNGQLYTEWLSISAIRNRRGRITHYMGMFTDIKKKKQDQEVIRHLSSHDILTNLPNHAFFKDILRIAMIRAKKKKELLGILFLDLDRVKMINDSLGHATGDQLLKIVARRLKHTLRKEDTVARLGGDEFLILIPQKLTVDDIKNVADKILLSLHPAFTVDKRDFYITGSIGIAVYPGDGDDPDTLLKNADSAMYHAKKRGRDNYHLFDANMNTEARQQLVLSQALRRALDHHEFVVYYQPQMDLKTGLVVGAEALVRWRHPQGSLIHPSGFIPWAEESGLIVPIGELVLKMACEQNKKWRDKGLPPLRVAVNLSAQQIKRSDFVKTVTETLAATDLPAEALELELTESTLLEIERRTTSVPHELRSMGIGFSIDDFGTGYSSLSYLKRLPVNMLKMDQSFVHDITTDPNDAAIASAIIGLGHGLGLDILAEGVETPGQLEALKDLGCDRVQGLLCGEPMPAPDFEKWLKGERRLAVRR